MADLERELHADPRFMRLQTLKKMRTDYLAVTGPARAPTTLELVAGSQPAAAPRSTTLTVRARTRSIDPRREALLEKVRVFLAGKLAPTKTAEIFSHLEAIGVEVGGQDPRNNLSAIIHNSGRFKSFGRLGWMNPENAASYKGHSLTERAPTEDSSAM